MRKNFTVFGKVVTFDSVIEKGAVTVRDGIIDYVGEKENVPCIVGEIYDFFDKTLVPGFVDIHCHASPMHWAYENPEEFANYHLKHGTTSVLCTLYRDIPFEKLLVCLDKIKHAMKSCPSIRGAHLEGPYLNPKYGTGKLDSGESVSESEYLSLANSGIIKQWTYAPEVSGTDKFARDISKLGIVPAIGHSSASPEDVKRAEKDGARIVTHLFDATGCANDPPLYDGTIEASFNVAALICDNFFYEIILDSKRIHVRSELLRLAVKAVGVDRIIGITDCCAGGIDDESDVNVVNGELYGSRLTMNGVFENFVKEGFSLPEVARITSYNPAKAVGIEKIGKIEKGYYADIAVLDGDYNVTETFLTEK